MDTDLHTDLNTGVRKLGPSRRAASLPGVLLVPAVVAVGGS